MRSPIFLPIEELKGRLPSFESYLETLNAEQLKKLARVWHGKDAYKMNKEATFQAVQKAFSDPSAISRMVESLPAFERAGLGLVKLRGSGIVYVEEFAVELLMLGFISPRYRSYGRYSHYEGVNHLLGTGLARRIDGANREIDEYNRCQAVFADLRLLDHIELTPPPEIDISSVAHSEPGVARRSGEVLLDLAAFAQAVNKIGGIQLTAKLIPAKPSLSKLSKTLGWTDSDDKKSLTPLPNRTGFYLHMIEAAGLLHFDSTTRHLSLRRDIETAMAAPFEEQSRLWAAAWRSLHNWIEHKPGNVYLYSDELIGQNKFNGLRAAILMAMAALPDPKEWYGIADFSDAIYRRIGDRFSLGYKHNFYPPFNTPKDKTEEARAKWMKEEHDNWRKHERAVVEHAIIGPLFHLGLVEVACKKRQGTPDIFRLTDAGRAATIGAFNPEPSPSVGSAPRDEPCWVVQPNFDVLVYLDKAAPQQLGFIERVAERLRADSATALYRLTREATYLALESGVEAEAMIRTLKSGSLHEAPDSIVRSIEDWARRRERISVLLNTRVLEFGDTNERDAAIQTGEVKGEVIGDRFILVSKIRSRSTLRNIIFYEPDIPRCITVSETGDISIREDERDLLIDGELAAYCERKPDGANDWRITRASVQAAKGRGWNAQDILKSLSLRAKAPIPAILDFAIRAWSGGRSASASLALPTAPILLVEDLDLARAISESRLLGRCLELKIGANAFLVKRGSMAELKKRLKEFGLNLGDEVQIVENLRRHKK